METKGLVCNLLAGRRKEGKGALKQLKRLTKEKP
jgi:hypothetical protein